MKNLLKLGGALSKTEQQNIRGGLGASSGGNYNVICEFPNGEWWEGNATTEAGAIAMENHCYDSGGEVSEIK